VTRVLITGGAGNVGTVLRRGLHDRYALRTLDLVTPEPVLASEQVVIGDLRDPAVLASAVVDVDAIVHLGGIPVEAPFDDVVEHNVRGTHRILEAARTAGIRRVVLASTNHVIGYHPTDTVIDADVMPRPDTFYGVSKLAAEGLASLYADKFGLETVSVRIGSCLERPEVRRNLWTWLSHRDAVALFEACLTGPVTGHTVVYGMSANTRSWWDGSAASALGYAPVDDAERFLATIEAADPWEAADLTDPTERFQGGPFVGWFAPYDRA
jgi:uronate dehydrogenase